MGKTIGVVSLKGGVGKTSVVASLGAALAEFGKKILLIDANLSAPNLGLHLNVLEPETTLHHVLNKEANIGDAIYRLDNFDLIPSSLFQRFQINPLKLKDKIKNLKRKYDITLIDSSPTLNEETLGAMLASDELFVVTTPDYATLSTTLKSIKMARQRGVNINGLILNKVHNKNFELSIDEIEDTIGIPVMAVIPHDINVLKAQADFSPSVFYKPNSEGSEEFRKLAAALIGEKYSPSIWRDFFRITPKRQDINREIFYKRVFKD